jgi:hypothetical protein
LGQDQALVSSEAGRRTVSVSRYDREAVLVLDDWTLGVGPTPEQFLARLLRGGMRHAKMPGMSMAGIGGMHHSADDMTMGDSRNPLGADAGNVRHPLYLSTAARRRRRQFSRAGRGSGCGCGSSTRPPIPPSGWRWAATAFRSPMPTAFLSGRSLGTRC